MGELAEKKIQLQSKGIRISPDIEEKLSSKFAGCESDYPSFFIRDTPVGMLNGFYTDSSPYEIRENGGGYAIFDGENAYTEIKFMPRPKFFDAQTKSGIMMERMCKMVAPGFPIIYMSTSCVFWGEKQCKFCVIGYVSTEKEKKPGDVADVVEAGVKEGAIKSHIALTCGAMPRDRCSNLLADTVKAVKDRVKIPISVNIEPPRDLSSIERLAESGADSIYINLEVFDERSRKEFLPGKSCFGIDYYEGAFEKCLDSFDDNQVASVMLAGLESDESYLEGVEHLACCGVMPVVIPLYPTYNSKLNDRKPPSAERMKNLYHAAADIIEEYGLDPFKTKAGFMRGGSIFALKEVMKDV